VLYNAVFALGAMRCRRARPALVRVATEDHRTYQGLETISQIAWSSIRSIDDGPPGR
jgi:hypothetical protein